MPLTLPLHNANRTMHLLNKSAVKGIPDLYKQDGKGDQAIVYLKFFMDSFTWFVTELDQTTGLAFGKVFSSMCPDGELGYIDLLELSRLSGSIGQAVERDRHFKETTIGELKNQCK